MKSDPHKIWVIKDHLQRKQSKRRGGTGPTAEVFEDIEKDPLEVGKGLTIVSSRSRVGDKVTQWAISLLQRDF